LLTIYAMTTFRQFVSEAYDLDSLLLVGDDGALS